MNFNSSTQILHKSRLHKSVKDFLTLTPKTSKKTVSEQAWFRNALSPWFSPLTTRLKPSERTRPYFPWKIRHSTWDINGILRALWHKEREREGVLCSCPQSPQVRLAPPFNRPLTLWCTENNREKILLLRSTALQSRSTDILGAPQVTPH